MAFDLIRLLEIYGFKALIEYAHCFKFNGNALHSSAKALLFLRFILKSNTESTEKFR